MQLTFSVTATHLPSTTRAMRQRLPCVQMFLQAHTRTFHLCDVTEPASSKAEHTFARSLQTSVSLDKVPLLPCAFFFFFLLCCSCS